MGLDMYFSVRRPIRSYPHLPERERESVLIIKGGIPAREQIADPSTIEYVQYRVGYLRKANQIHYWIDRRVENGVTNCQPVRLDLTDIEDLLGTINRVLRGSKLVNGEVCVGYQFSNGQEKPLMQAGKTIADPTLAQELLPTGAGFFFGSLDYNQFYIDDLEEAKAIMERILADKTAEDILYEASR